KKIEILREIMFPLLESIDLLDINGTEYPEAVSIPREITDDNILGAIKILPNDKAPRLDGILNRCLKRTI
ncbi:hypothetical protein EJ05DRAFT_443504, partial [Pseudovirgaria hyperparasitica]